MSAYRTCARAGVLIALLFGVVPVLRAGMSWADFWLWLNGCALGGLAGFEISYRLDRALLAEPRDRGPR
jgi:hypothetical protein